MSRSGEPARGRLTVSAVAVAVLLAVQPVVGFVQNNNYQLVPIGMMARVAIVVASVTVVVLLVATRLSRADPRRLGPVIGVVAYSAMTAGAWLDPTASDATKRIVQVLAWTMLTGAVAVLVFKLAVHEWFRTFLLVFAVILVVLPAVSVVTFRLDLRDQPLANVTPVDPPPVVDGTPNVYWLLMDEHARPDVLAQYPRVDVGGFLDELTQRGFEVSSSTLAGYTRTPQSVASTLFMDYVFEPGAGLRNEYAVAGPIFQGHNPTVEQFRAHGYQYVYGESGMTAWASCEVPAADRCLPLSGGPFDTDDVGVNFVNTTLLGLARVVGYGRQDLDTDAEVLGELARSGSPFFAFVHIMSPHWPYRYAPDCSPLQPPVEGFSAKVEERMALYADQVRCLDTEVMGMIDRVLAADPGAVIVLQGDHGSSFAVNFAASPDGWSSAALSERLAPFSAVRLPERCRVDDRYSVDGQPLVNTFRIVFACLEGRTPDLLPTRAFLSSWESVADLQEISLDRLTAP